MKGLDLKPKVMIIPTYLCQSKFQFWPEPCVFDPERFGPERSRHIHPMTYIPFGAGPHGCIGSRLGVLQLKLGIAHILKQYWVETCERTVSEIRFNPKSFMLESENEIYLRFCRSSL